MSSGDILALCIGGIILIGSVIFFWTKEKKKILGWLKDAVVEAEKQLGSKTGQLKLHKVYAWFCEQFSFISTILPFKVFSAWVDTALLTMRKWIETNSKIEDYIKNK